MILAETDFFELEVSKNKDAIVGNDGKFELEKRKQNEDFKNLKSSLR
jgi:hypothetical protein